MPLGGRQDLRAAEARRLRAYGGDDAKFAGLLVALTMACGVAASMTVSLAPALADDWCARSEDFVRVWGASCRDYQGRRPWVGSWSFRRSGRTVYWFKRRTIRFWALLSD